MEKEKRKEIERREKRGEKVEKPRIQAIDSTDGSNFDLSGKGAKLGYYIIVYDYVYVLLLFLRVFKCLGF